LLKGKLRWLKRGDGGSDDLVILRIDAGGVAVPRGGLFGREYIVKPEHVLGDGAGVVVRGVEDESLAREVMLLLRVPGDDGDHFVA